jgi:YD repeat-containing protein
VGGIELERPVGPRIDIFLNASLGVVDAVGTDWDYEYDSAGRVVAILYRDNLHRMLTYDSEWLVGVSVPSLQTCWRSYLDGQLVETSWKDLLNTTLDRVRYS